MRCVIFRGAGRCFSAGFEIADDDVWVEGDGPAEVVDDMRFYMELGALDLRVPEAHHRRRPLVLPGGRVRGDDALRPRRRGRRRALGEPEIRFSNGPPALIMPWIIGMRAAKELLYTGKMIDAAARAAARAW